MCVCVTLLGNCAYATKRVGGDWLCGPKFQPLPGKFVAEPNKPWPPQQQGFPMPPCLRAKGEDHGGGAPPAAQP